LAYRVVLTPAAQRQLDHVRGVPLVALRGAILALADEPRPPGGAKLAGHRNLWRLRLRVDGRPWRVVYQLDEAERLVIVTRIARRDEGTYRRL
jgi:mRNA interferase RelE/StbE